MDSESFLDLLAVPSFDDLCSAWGSPSDSDPCSMEGSAAFADYFDELINTEYRVNEEENDDDDEEEVELARSGFSKDSASLTRPPRCVLESVSSEKYSSVLKLSDIASALRNFSRTSEVSRPASRKLSSNRDFHVGSLSRPLSRPSDVNQNSDEHNLRCKDMGVESRPKKASDGSCGVRPHAIMVAGTQMSASNLLRCNSITVDETDQTRSNPCSIGRSMCDSSEDESSECSEEDDGPHSVLCEDTKPPIAHVKIIRRPNSNCGQRMSASPKRMKTVHLSAEATSSSEMVATADERDGADNLKQMRKDGMSQREVHILSERQRRKSMRESFSILQSLVPKLKLKHTDRITVLTEVITYIQSLRGALDELERKKADMMEFLGLSGKHRSRRQEDDLQATVTYIDPGNNLDDKVTMDLIALLSLH
ncbi:hypothetical protein KP509_01G118800 [Ceratopteris richardii]|uniref:BHLH domain-containing protein n=1 Tax=Ceratopteris richardii TaxID=49495 RepID=A0A8T2VKW3_CERRI|nr:hypothetical protein KP509_01G118800 [Ceratopteris richardii]